MPRRLIICLLWIGLTAAIGCSAARDPLPTIEPAYSIREAQPGIVANDIWPNQTTFRAAYATDANLVAAEGTEIPALNTVPLSTASVDELHDLLRVD